MNTMYTYKGTITMRCKECNFETVFTVSEKSLSDDNFIDIVEQMVDNCSHQYCHLCQEATEQEVSDYSLPDIDITL